jgi:hypothetical protein
MACYFSNKCATVTHISYSVTTVEEIHKQHTLVVPKVIAMIFIIDGSALEVDICMSWLLFWFQLPHD